MKRTEANFSEHELTIKQNEDILIHHLKHPKYNQMYSIKFINTNGVMVVTGDYGNWVFCREFHPSDDGFVSDYYWCEKLSLSSEQTPFEFNPEETERIIKEGLNGGLEEYGYVDEKLEEMIEYYNELLDYTHNEFEYTSFAYNNNKPRFIDAEQVPMEETIKPRLKVVFDAFDEICGRLRMEKESINEISVFENKK
jgi:hypothetical protein